MVPYYTNALGQSGHASLSPMPQCSFPEADLGHLMQLLYQLDGRIAGLIED
jgi:uncharacterized protein (DUF3820 family)